MAYPPMTGKVIVTVPRERVGALIGKKGAVKKEIEEKLRVKLDIKEDGTVIIEPREGATINDVLKARKVVEAIGYGFPPEEAFKLMNDEYILEVIDLKDIIGDKRHHLQRIKARLIGEEGRARRTVEELSGASVRIYENYVVIIGTYDEVRIAREGIMRLIHGSRHVTAYARMRRLKREIERQRLLKMLGVEEFEQPEELGELEGQEGAE